MATVPPVPNFVLFDDSVPNLQDLSACVAFGCQMPVHWKFVPTTNQAYSTASTNVAVTFSKAVIDTDGVFTTGGVATIKTTGYYDIELAVATSNSAAGGVPWAIWVLVTTGANNPLGSGVTRWVCHYSDYMTGQSGVPQIINAQDTTPCLYSGDTLTPYFFLGSTTTLVYNSGVSANNTIGGNADAPAFYFSGRLVALGP